MELWNAIRNALGVDADSHQLTILQMMLRAVVVYIVALALLRVGDKRFLGKNTAFDVIIGIVYGSIVSRAITGQSAFFPTLAAAMTVVLCHWLFAALGFYFNSFAWLIKGDNRVLVKDGEIQWDAMRRSHIGERDLMTALRTEGNVLELEEVREARLERDGNISVLKKES